MILKRFGNRMHQVTPNFDARAMTEISFLRGEALEESADDFLAAHEKTGEHSLIANASGTVQGDVEAQVLNDLQQQLARIEGELPAGSVLLVESEAGNDYPKTRGRQATKVIEGENRFHFDYDIDPPLRVGVYRRRA